MSSRELALKIVKELRQRGHQAYWAGGCVRDVLLGHEPKDFDVATGAAPQQVLQHYPRANLAGAQFGVVLVREDQAQVEVATFRRDHDYRDGRHPSSVTFTPSAEEDARRRDFTINGLLYDPFSEECLDYVGGQRDLQAGVIRAIGDADERIGEDKLRMLRAVRFAARLNFRIEAKTFEALKRHAAEISGIAAERVRDELNRILTEGAARRGLELLSDTGLLDAILPEVAAMKGVEQPPEFHPEGDVWTHTLLMLDGLKTPSLTLALGVLLHDAGKPPTYRVSDRIRFNGHVEEGMRIAENICSRLRYSSAETEQVLALIGNHMRFMHVTQMRQSTLKRFMRQPRFDEHMELHRLDCLSSHRKLGSYEFVLGKLAETPAEHLRPPRLLSGDDLISWGYEPGPSFQRILSEVEDAQLEESLGTRDEAADYVRRHFAPPDGRRAGD